MEVLAEAPLHESPAYDPRKINQRDHNSARTFIDPPNVTGQYARQYSSEPRSTEKVES